MNDYQREDLLILTKTYPEPSAKYRETTCVAALTRNGAMKRIFPVRFRYFSGEQQFKKWEWINVSTKKSNDDHRPESFKIDFDSVIERTGEKVDTKNDWAQRMPWLSPHIVSDFAALEERRQASGETLGIIRPHRVLDLTITAVKEIEWTEKEKSKLQSEGLFDTDEYKRPLLRKLPFIFHYRYECETPNGIQSLRHMITDWEVGALFWNCYRSYGDNWESPFRQKMEEELPSKDLMFLMGTVHRFPGQWLIVGLFYPPKPKPGTGQLTLL